MQESSHQNRAICTIEGYRDKGNCLVICVCKFYSLQATIRQVGEVGKMLGLRGIMLDVVVVVKTKLIFPV
jgi:hypothetical protein